jgi:hypothetical protein
MKTKGNFQFSVGGASILMIFVVLCLTAFGILSYVTANADSRISEKNAEAVQNYYKADGKIQEGLKQIDAALLTAKTDAKQAAEKGSLDGSKNKELYQGSAEIQPILSAELDSSDKSAACYRVFARILLVKCPGVVIESTQESDDTLNCTLTADADQNRKIAVKLTVAPYPADERYKITDERLISAQKQADASSASAAAIPDDEGPLHLWQGSSKAS